MTNHDLLIQLDVKRFSELICNLVHDFPTPEKLEKQLSFPVSEEMIKRINDAAKMESRPVSFSYKD